MRKGTLQYILVAPGPNKRIQGRVLRDRIIDFDSIGGASVLIPRDKNIPGDYDMMVFVPAHQIMEIVYAI